MPAAYVPLVLSCLLIFAELASDFEQIIVPVFCFLALFVNWTLFCLMSAEFVH